jgi:uncharacterized protein (DUF2141 family)
MKSIKVLLPLILLYSCAQIVIPDGGQKDVTPPVLIKSIPQQNAVSIYPKTIDLYFNENIEVKNQSENISITPKFSSIPKIKIKKNKIELELEKDSLKPNTTYCINFGKGIVDINEGNVLENFYYTFSTGNSIDTATIYGKVIAIKENKPLDKTSVQLKNSKTFVNYETFSDKDGEWRINNIAPGSYSLLTFKDNNSNKKLDMYEFYYYDTISIKDKPKIITSKLIYFQSQSNSISLSVLKCNYINENAISLKLNKQLTDVKSIKYSFDSELSKKENLNIISTSKADSFLIIHPFYVKDTLIFTIQTGTLQRFTIPQPKKRKQDKLSLASVALLTRKGDPNYIISTVPIKLINSEKIKINGLNTGFTINSITPYKLSIQSEIKTNKQIIFEPGALTDINGEENKGDTILIKIAADEETGNYEFVIKDSTQNYEGPILVKISNPFSEYTITTELNKINKIRGLLPSNYSIEIWEDENSNGLWDEGNYYEKRNPEKILLLKDFISIKPNWDTVGVEIYID